MRFSAGHGQHLSNLMPSAEETLEMIRRFVAEQAEDHGLWFCSMTAAETYVQQELRRLHRVIETGVYETPAHLD